MEFSQLIPKFFFIGSYIQGVPKGIIVNLRAFVNNMFIDTFDSQLN